VSDEVEEIIGDEGATNAPAPERIQPVDLQMEMQRSYLDYAMSVIVGRALPDVRDGLKPVHRRVLYAMYDGGYRPTASFSKSSRIVGDVMGTYHPHGDSAIYDALARLESGTAAFALSSGMAARLCRASCGAVACRIRCASMRRRCKIFACLPKSSACGGGFLVARGRTRCGVAETAAHRQIGIVHCRHEYSRRND